MRDAHKARISNDLRNVKSEGSPHQATERRMDQPGQVTPASVCPSVPRGGGRGVCPGGPQQSCPRGGSERSGEQGGGVLRKLAGRLQVGGTWRRDPLPLGSPSCAENPQKVQFILNFQIFPWKVEATSSWKQTPKCHVTRPENGCRIPSLTGREELTPAFTERHRVDGPPGPRGSPAVAWDACTVLHLGGQG